MPSQQGARGAYLRLQAARKAKVRDLEQRARLVRGQQQILRLQVPLRAHTAHPF